MIRKLYLSAILFFCILGILSAQKNQRDSIWMESILSRGGEYQISSQTLEDIRQGKLFNKDVFRNEYIEILPESYRDTSLIQNNPSYGINLFHISPAEVLMYQHTPDSLFIIKSAQLSKPNDVLIQEYIRIPLSQIENSIPLTTTELDVYHGAYREFIMPKPVLTFSTEDILQYIFNPAERHKMQNRKNANAWKTYNMEDLSD